MREAFSFIVKKNCLCNFPNDHGTLCVCSSAVLTPVAVPMAPVASFAISTRRRSSSRWCWTPTQCGMSCRKRAGRRFSGKPVEEEQISWKAFMVLSRKVEVNEPNLLLHNKIPKKKMDLTKALRVGPVWIRHGSHKIPTQPNRCVDRAGWQAKMASIDVWLPWRNAHGPN